MSPTPPAHVGVVALTDIPTQAIVGPYPRTIPIGLNTCDKPSISCVLEIKWKDGRVMMDGDPTNQWMVYIQPARDRHEQNVEAYMDEKHELCLRFIRSVKTSEQLLVWYNDELARYKGIPILKPQNIRGNQEYTCTACEKTFQFPNSLKAHIRFRCLKSREDQQEKLITSSAFDKKRNMWGRSGLNDIHPYSAFSQLSSVRPDVSSYKPTTFINKLDKVERISRLPHMTHTTSDQAINLSKRDVVFSTASPINPASTVSQPIQIFNHIHTPAFPIAMDNTALRLYHPFLSPYNAPTRMCCNQIPSVHHVIDNRDHCISSYERSFTSSSPGVNRHSPPHMPCNFPLPSDKQGEPLDLLPKSLYTSKSRRGHLCIYCGKLYSRKYGLKIHLRTHTGYKPLKCKVCLRPFGDPSNLNKHVRLHAEGDTPYKCQFCGKVLVRRRDLERHIKSRHPDQTVVKSEIEADSSTVDSSLEEADSDSAETDNELIVA
ncbi:hypothetical protein SNE40_005865 [Patella caerulea]